MGESRVDDLVKKQQHLNKAVNDLSYAEYSEFCTRMGYPLPDLEFERVELLPPQELNLVLVSSESEGVDRRAELVEFNREETGEEDLSSTAEFMMYHTRPKWIQSDGQIPEGEQYIAEYLLNDVVTFQVGYDRSRMAALLEAILACNRIIEMYKDHPEKQWVHIEGGDSNAWVRGDNYDRIVHSAVIVTNKGTLDEQRWTPEGFIASLRRHPGWVDWFNRFDTSKEAWIKHMESFFTGIAALRVSEAIYLLGVELGTIIQNPSGIVPASVYENAVRFRSTTLRAQGRGGANNQKLDSSNENERRELGIEYTRLYETYRYINRRFRGCIREGQDWRKHLKLDYPELEEYPELLDIVGIMNKDTATLASNDEQRIEELLNLQIENPSDLALEIAARRVIEGYTWCHRDTLRRHKIDPA